MTNKDSGIIEMTFDRKAWWLAWYAKNKQEYLATRKRTKERNRPYFQSIARERQRSIRRRDRYTCMNIYSNGKMICDCCGEPEYRFLTLEHINGGGHKHRKEIGNGKENGGIFSWLRRKGYPEGYKVLCYNCNCCIGHLKECAHDRFRRNEINDCLRNCIL